MSTTQRNYSFDFARALCVLWIVGFWHLLNYLPQEFRLGEQALPICKEITFSVLACFTFLSGYFLKKYEFNKGHDVLTFYKKRFKRFYPLFVVAAFSLIICGSTIRQILFAITGLSMLYPPPIQTLWYFSMLLFFYLCTPLLKVSNKRTMQNIVFALFLLAILIGGYFFADRRMIMYFPFYVLGLNIPNKIVEKTLNIYTLLLSIGVFIGFCFIGSDNIVLQIIQALTGVFAILSFSKIVYNDKIQIPIAFIAEASMCAYLFHRPIYTIITVLLRKVSSYQYMPLLIAVISVIVVFIIGYYIQRLYNKLNNQISLKYGR